MKRRVVVIEGEDAAPEAMRPSVELIDSLGVPIEWVRPPVGAAAAESHGHVFPAVARDAIDAADATFFGSTSGPSAPALFHLRWGRKTYANVRPIRYLSGARSPLATPEGIDLVLDPETQLAVVNAVRGIEEETPEDADAIEGIEGISAIPAGEEAKPEGE